MEESQGWIWLGPPLYSYTWNIFSSKLRERDSLAPASVSLFLFWCKQTRNGWVLIHQRFDMMMISPISIIFFLNENGMTLWDGELWLNGLLHCHLAAPQNALRRRRVLKNHSENTFLSSGIGAAGAEASSFSSSSVMTNWPWRKSSSSCFSTSDFSRLFLIRIFRLSWLGLGRGTPGSN